MRNKTYLDNPALQFLSSSLVEEANAAPAEVPAAVAAPAATPAAIGKPALQTLPRPGRERRSKRFNALLRPSLYEALQARAAQEERSVNDLIDGILTKALR